MLSSLALRRILAPCAALALAAVSSSHAASAEVASAAVTSAAVASAAVAPIPPELEPSPPPEARAVAQAPKKPDAPSKEPLRKLATKHYELRVQGTAPQAEEVGLILEAAWKQYETFFGGAPSPGRRMTVKIYADETGFLNAAWTDGAVVPAQCRPAFWSDATTHLYLYGPLGSYSTRQALLFGAALQFHALAESKNRDLPREWYEAGMAHALSRHTWNGKDLVLRAKPLVEPYDFPREALMAIEQDPSGLPRLVDSEAPHPVLCWAAVGLCMEASRGRYKTAFDKYLLAKTGSKVPGDDFLRSLGPREQVARDLFVWLLDQQSPFEMPVEGFEDRGGGVLRGAASEDRVAFCILKDEENEHIECDLGEIPKIGARAGLVTGFHGTKDHVRITVVAPYVRIEIVRDDKTASSELIEIPGDHVRVRKIRLVRKGPECKIEVDGIDIGTRELPRGRNGLFVQGGPIDFSAIRWE